MRSAGPGAGFPPGRPSGADPRSRSPPASRHPTPQPASRRPPWPPSAGCSPRRDGPHRRCQADRRSQHGPSPQIAARIALGLTLDPSRNLSCCGACAAALGTMATIFNEWCDGMAPGIAPAVGAGSPLRPPSGRGAAALAGPLRPPRAVAGRGRPPALHASLVGVRCPCAQPGMVAGL